MSLVDCLPHHPPMRLIEEMVEIQHGESATGRRRTKPDDFYFQGHFPNLPVVPAVILIELLAQTGGIAARGASTWYIRRANEAARRRYRPVQVSGRRWIGGVLDARARVAGRMGGLIKIEGTVTADSVLVASGSLTLAREGRSGAVEPESGPR